MPHKKLLIGIILLGLIIMTSCAGQTITAQAKKTGQLNVNGMGTVYLVPEIARINLGIRNRAESPALAMAGNNESTNKVISDLKEMGVDPADIQTVSFNIYPEQIYTPGSEIPATNYTVENMVNITIRDLTNFSDLLDRVVREGANQIYGISYDLQNRDQAFSQARKLAIENATLRAEELANSAGVQLGKVISVATSSVNSAQPFYEGKGPVGSYAQTVPISGGQLVISVEATLLFEIQ